MTDKSYLFRLRGDAQELLTLTERAAQGIDKLAASTDAFNRDQAAAAAAGERFVQGLARQAASAGKTQSELLALRAAELGVADAAKPLIAQLDAAATAQQAETQAANRAAAAQRALAGIREAAQAQQRSAAQAQQQFIAGLQREADAIGKTRSQLLEQKAAQLGVAAQAGPLIQRLQASEKALGGFSKQGRLTALELQQIGFQLNDFGVQIASGQSPILALVQQGSQLSGTFGGVGNAARALVSLITPVRLALFGAAGAAGAVALAAIQGYTENREFEKSLALTGNRAGITAGQLDVLAQSVAASTRTTIASSREAVQAAVASAAFGPRLIGPVAEAVQNFSRLSGKSAEEVVKDFAQMQGGVAKFAAERNRSINFLTVEQFKYIRSLEAEGRVEEAQLATLDALSKKYGKDLPSDLGFLQRELKNTQRDFSNLFEFFKSIGRPETIEDQIAAATKGLEAAQRRIEASKSAGLRAFGSSPLLERGQEDAQAAAQAKLAGLQEQQRQLNRAAAEDASRAAANQEAIERSGSAFVDKQLGLQRAQLGQQQALRDLARARELQAVDRQYQRLEISEAQATARRAAIEQAGAADRLKALDADIAIERARVPDSTGTKAGQEREANDRAARLVELETRRPAILKEIAQSQGRLQTEQITQRRSFIEASLGVERAGFALEQAQGDAARAAELSAVEAQYARLEISPEQFAARREAIDIEAARARVAAVQNEIAIEARRPKVEGDDQPLQRAARELELKKQLTAAESDLAEVTKRRAGVALQASRELIDTNRQLSIDLIVDERARGQAVIDFEAEQLRKRLDLDALSGDQRIAAEARVAQYILLRQQQLTEQLKPEYQRLLEQWRDTTKLLQDASDRFQDDFLRRSEDTFVTFIKTGKLSFKGFADAAIEELARVQFREGLAPLVGQAGNAIARSIGLGAGTPKADPQAIAQSANTLALGQSTLALNAFTGALGGTSVSAQAQALAQDETTSAFEDLQRGVFGTAQSLDGFGGIAVRVGQALLTLASQAGAGDGGSGFFGQLIGAAASIFTGSGASIGNSSLGIGGATAGFTSDFGSSFGGASNGPAFGTSAQTAFGVNVLQFDGQRAKGGGVKPGTFVEVAEGGRPELYQTDAGRTYLLDPQPGNVIPFAPAPPRLPRAEGQGAGIPGPVIVQVEIVNNGTPQRESRPAEMGADGRLRVFVEDIVADSINSGGKVARSMSNRFGASSSATLKR